MSDYQPQYGNEPKTPFDAPAQRRGMSGCMKAFLIIGILGIVSLLTCCIGGWFYIRSGVISDPIAARAVANEIIDWKFNEELEAKGAVKFFFARMAFLFEPEKGLVLVVDSKYADAKQTGQQLDGQLRSQMQGGASTEETELLEKLDRDIEIKGETISFTFNKTRGVESKQEYWEVMGIVPGNDHPTFVMIKVLASAYSDAEIEERLAGIK